MFRFSAVSAGAALALALVALPAAPTGAAGLELWGEDPPRLLLSREAAPGTVVRLEHVNSMYDAPVVETYVLQEAGLVQTGLESPSAGVLEYHGFDPSPGASRSLARPLAGIRLLSMSYERHRLVIAGEEISLNGLAPPGRAVIIKAVDHRAPTEAPNQREAGP